MHKLYAFLGLCKKAGKLADGEMAAEIAVKKNKAVLLLLAQDASFRTKKKFTDAAAYRNISLIQFGEKEALGRAIGKEERAILAVLDEGLAKKIALLAADSNA